MSARGCFRTSEAPGRSSTRSCRRRCRFPAITILGRSLGVQSLDPLSAPCRRSKPCLTHAHFGHRVGQHPQVPGVASRPVSTMHVSGRAHLERRAPAVFNEAAATRRSRSRPGHDRRIGRWRWPRPLCRSPAWAASRCVAMSGLPFRPEGTRGRSCDISESARPGAAANSPTECRPSRNAG